MNKAKSSGVPGVNWQNTSRTWQVGTTFQGVWKYLGSFPEELLRMAIDCRNEGRNVLKAADIDVIREKYNRLKREVKEGLEYKPRSQTEQPAPEQSVDIPQEPPKNGGAKTA